MTKPKKASVTVDMYKSMADHYRVRVKRHAAACAEAMEEGDMSEANAHYQQGIFCQRNLDHYQRISSCIGTFPLALSGPDHEEPPQ